jgi:hypothetical protein
MGEEAGPGLVQTVFFFFYFFHIFYFSLFVIFFITLSFGPKLQRATFPVRKPTFFLFNKFFFSLSSCTRPPHRTKRQKIKSGSRKKKNQKNKPGTKLTPCALTLFGKGLFSFIMMIFFLSYTHALALPLPV